MGSAGSGLPSSAGFRVALSYSSATWDYSV